MTPRSPTRRAFVAVALLALALPATAAQTAGVGLHVAGSVDVEGELRLNVSAAESSNVTLLVTHEDPLLGTVVDRVVPVSVDANGSVEIDLDDLRAEAEFEVRVVSSEVELPTLPNLTSVLDLSRLDEIVDLAPRVELPPLSPLARNHTNRVWTYDVGAPMGAGEKVLVTPKGHVVAVWYQDSALVASVSRDGGHTFEAAVTLDSQTPGLVDPPREEDGMTWIPPAADYAIWDFAAGPDGSVVVVYQLVRQEYGNYSAADHRIARYDPFSGSVSSVRLGGPDETVTFRMFDFDLALSSTGEVLLGFDGEAMRATGPDSWQVMGSTESGFQLWRVEGDGSVEYLSTVAYNAGSSFARLAASEVGDVVAVVGTHGRSDARDTNLPFHAVSFDGGRTWGEARTLVDLYPVNGYWLFPVQATVDATGTIHAVFTGQPDGEQPDAAYVRIEADGDARRVSLSEMTPREEARHVYSPSIALSQGRVWVFWDAAGDMWAAESVTLGASFAAPYRLLDADGDKPLHPGGYRGGVSVFPDGRPLLHVSENGLSVVAPLFDPLPSLASRLTRVVPPMMEITVPPPPEERTGEAPSDGVETGEGTTSEDEPFVLVHAELVLDVDGLDVAADDEVIVRGTLRNVGNGPARNVTLRVDGLPADVTVASGLAQELTIETGGAYPFLLRLVGDVRAATGPSTSIVATDGLVIARAQLPRSPFAPTDGIVTPPPSEPPSLPPLPVVGGDAPDRQSVVPVPPVDPPTLLLDGIPLAVIGALAALAGIAAIVARTTDVGRYALYALVAPFYTRLERGQALDHPVRQNVFEHVRSNPGVRFEELRGNLELASGAAAFHLRVLEREGYVVSRAEWTRRRFYATGAAPTQAAAADVQTTLVRVLRENGPQSPADVARTLSISRQLASYHLKALETEGVVESDGAGRALKYRVR